jgi:hypothetical protein
MSMLVVGAVGLVVCLMITLVRWRSSEEARTRLAARFAAKMDLGLPEGLVPGIGRRLDRRRRMVDVTTGVAFAGWVLVALVAGLGTGTAMDGPSLLAAYGLVILARGGGELLMFVADARSGSADRIRAAHLTRPRVADFLTPFELWSGRGAAAVTVAVAAWLALRIGDAHAVVLLAGTIVLWLLIEVLVAGIARSRPTAGDVQSLAFDDALRAESLRRVIGSLGLLPLASWFVAMWRGAPTPAIYLLMAVALAVATVQLWADGSGLAKRRFRTRLWADPAPVRR